jgi:chromatin segregation and condensation protein Rec8/ScpA/Scc1 (kleisin family)
MSGVNVESLLTAVRAALERAAERDDSVSIVQPRRLTIEAQIAQVRRRIKRGEQFKFHDLLGPAVSRTEISVTLLAVLELIKRREITAYQSDDVRPDQYQILHPVTNRR